MSDSISNFFTWRTAILKSKLPSSTRLLLLTISCHMNEMGQNAFPSQRTLAKETGLSIPCINKHLKIAQKEGYLIKENSTKKDGSNGPNFYFATLPENNEGVLNEVKGGYLTRLRGVLNEVKCNYTFNSLEAKASYNNYPEPEGSGVCDVENTSGKVDKPSPTLKRKQPVPNKKQNTPPKKNNKISSHLLKIAKAFLEKQKLNHPNKIKTIPKKKIESSAIELEKLIRIDGHSMAEIEPVINWAIDDDFWSGNLLSLTSIRKKGSNGEMKFVNIISAMEREKGQGKKKSAVPEYDKAPKGKYANLKYTKWGDGKDRRMQKHQGE